MLPVAEVARLAVVPKTARSPRKSGDIRYMVMLVSLAQHSKKCHKTAKTRQTTRLWAAYRVARRQSSKNS